MPKRKSVGLKEVVGKEIEIDSDNESDVETVALFRCRKCPDQTFTAAERDAHRFMHKGKGQKTDAGGSSPPKRTRLARQPSSRKKSPSPPPPDETEVVLFEPVPDSPEIEEVPVARSRSRRLQSRISRCVPGRSSRPKRNIKPVPASLSKEVKTKTSLEKKQKFLRFARLLYAGRTSGRTRRT